jgi:type IV secretory pathway VirB2 component (pilin)
MTLLWGNSLPQSPKPCLTASGGAQLLANFALAKHTPHAPLFPLFTHLPKFKIMEKFFTGVVAGIVGFAVVAALGLVIAFPVMILWNWLIPAIFGLKTITFLEAFGLYGLCAILFQSSISSSK